MAGVEVGDIHTIPVSHGEGRFIAGRTQLAELAAKGQIATQYVDLDDRPTMDLPYNPNYSDGAVEESLRPMAGFWARWAIRNELERTCIKMFRETTISRFASGVRYFR